MRSHGYELGMQQTSIVVSYRPGKLWLYAIESSPVSCRLSNT